VTQQAIDESGQGSRFLDAAGRPRLSHDFLRRVLTRPLTANVRELKHLLLLSLTKSKGASLDWFEPEEDDVPETGDDGEAARIQRALDENNGSLEKTWRDLGLGSRFALMRRVKKYKLIVRKKAE
jgi:transcriptional regulator of acetoin/glycerol metabolism